MSKIEVDAIDKQSGSTLTIGGSGTTVQLGSGATQSGFGRSGSVNWQTSIKTVSFTAASGEGYFCDTATTGAFTLTLPSSPSVGDIVALKDYASNFATANLTIGRNGSNLNGDTTDSVRKTDNESLTLVYADATKGWLAVEEGTGFVGETFMTASGGTETDSGDFKIHTFTGPGTFTVSSLASCSGNNAVNYLVVAGGGGGIGNGGGGGGGGARFFASPDITSYPASPRNAPAGVTVTATSFPITVGGGGTPGGAGPGNAGNGNPSVFSTITSTAGAGGQGQSPSNTLQTGGSGAGRKRDANTSGGGAGNTPPTTPAQGSNGGGSSTFTYSGGGGGGGFMVAGADGVGGSQPAEAGGNGGNGGGFPTSFVGSNGQASSCEQFFAGGGGGGAIGNGPVVSPNGQPGLGGGGIGGINDPAYPRSAGNGTANTGGGAGGAGNNTAGGTGGSGIVIIRYKFK